VTSFAVRARVLRTKLGLSQRAMAVRLEVSRVTINRWENGRLAPRGTILQDFEHLEAGQIPCPHCNGTGFVHDPRFPGLSV
jgi:transcriptional regulator with XRE-family HTH domain